MSDQLSLTVIILNRNRQRELVRTLRSLCHQTRRDFSVVVVSNQPDFVRSVLPEGTFAEVVTFVDANVSAARNAGLRATNADLVAFCDDDAVPEPTWLDYLIQPFADPDVGAVGGLVRGRNGVSIQWNLQEVDRFGNDWPVNSPGQVVSDAPSPDRVLKPVGTNCAFRRSALLAAGGFDEAYRFYLEEADLAWRLKLKKWRIIGVRSAEVHHGYARSDYRNRERVPKTLFEIGASKVHFCNKFASKSDVSPELIGFRNAQRSRLVRSFNLGLLAPSEVQKLMASLDAGMAAGSDRLATESLASEGKEIALRNYCDVTAPEPVVLSPRPRNLRKTLRECEAISGTKTVTVVDFRWSTRALTARFTDEGFWYHKGGVFGRESRDEPLAKLSTRRARLRREIERLAGLRWAREARIRP